MSGIRNSRDVERCSMIVRGSTVMDDPRSPAGWIEDGAVCIRGDQIVAVGPYEVLRQSFDSDCVVGSADHIVLPGLVNAHDHGRGPTAFQMGIPDDALESWILDLARLPAIDPYLSTAYSCAQLIESGVTTVLNSFYEGNAGAYETVLEDTSRAYSDSGMRARLALSVLDQSAAGKLAEACIPHLPADYQPDAVRFAQSRNPIPFDDYAGIVRAWQKPASGRVGIMMGPVSFHWCSQELLTRIWETARSLGLNIQMHLLESEQQRRDAEERYQMSAVAYLAKAGMLSSFVSCAHCVKVDERDLEMLADSGAWVIHNASSNLRLCNGIAPVGSMLQHGVNVALGLDSQALNDDADMFQEMRLVHLLQRVLNGNVELPTAGQVLTMATVNGASALGLADQVGILAEGKKADLILVNRSRIETPMMDADRDVAERLVVRGKAQDVDTVIVDGEMVYHNGQHLKLDKKALEDAIREQARAPRSRETIRFHQMVKELNRCSRRLAR